MRAALVLGFVLAAWPLATPAAAVAGASFLVAVDASLHVLPERGVATFPFWVNATCLGAPPPVGDVRLSITAPAWTNVTLAPTSVTFTATDCATGGAPSRSGLVTVGQTPEAVAYSVGSLVLVGTFDAPGARESSTDAARVKATFAGAVDARANASRGAFDPNGNAAFDVRVTNLANGDVLVRWRVESASASLSFSGIDDATLGTRLNTSAPPSWRDHRVVVHSDAPSREARVTLAVRGLDPYSGSGAPPARVTLTIDPMGARAVSGAAAGGVLPALAVAALALRSARCSRASSDRR